MGYCKDPFGMSRQMSRANKTFNGIVRAGVRAAKAWEREAKAQQRAHERQQAAYQRYLVQEERNRIRAIKAQEVADRRAEREREAAMRREERERAKAERERQKAAQIKAKNDEIQRIEAEMDAINEENSLWCSMHHYIDPIITNTDVEKAITDCLAERADIKSNNLFTIEYPAKAPFIARADLEAENKFRVNVYEIEVKEEKKNFCNTETNYNLILGEEPTKDAIVQELTDTAAKTIKAFWPWKEKRLRKEFVEKRADVTYYERHAEWQKRRDEYKQIVNKAAERLTERKASLAEQKKLSKEYIEHRSEELFQAELATWTEQRNQFFDTYLQTMSNLIDGDKDYVLNAINDAFSNDAEELPMEYFLEISYDEITGKVSVDLDLPEIEDIPQNKIVVNPSGKRSVRSKSQTNLREDYANCVCGLSMYVAGIIFNTCIKIKEVEISGFTQRCGDNSALATDQYVLLVRYTREQFMEIVFEQLTSLEIINFFKHNMDMTKSFVLKEINLDKAREKMEAFLPAVYGEYIAKPNKVNIVEDESI